MMMNPQFPGQYGPGQPQLGPTGQQGGPGAQMGGMRQPLYNGQPPVTGKDNQKFVVFFFTKIMEKLWWKIPDSKVVY